MKSENGCATMTVMATTTRKAGRPSISKDLIVLFALPVAIAILAALAVYVPQIGAKPQQDFIYARCQTYDCGTTYLVDAGNRVQKQAATEQYRSGQEILYYYTVATDTTRPLSLEEAQRYMLNANSRSDDGYLLYADRQEAGFLFWSDGGGGWYLKNGFKKKPVTLTQKNTYDGDVRFIGWVQK